MDFFVYKVILDQNADEVSVSLDDDLAEYQWVEFSRLSEITLTPPSVDLFKKLGYLA